MSYSVAALVRAKTVRKGGMVQFVTQGDPGTLVSMVRAAAIRATEPFLDQGLDGEDTISLSGCAAAPGGPIVVFSLCDTADLLEAWLTAFAADLDQAGLSGRIQAVKSVEPVHVNAPMVTLGIALEVDADRVRRSFQVNWDAEIDQPDITWFVSEERTRRVLPGLIAWCLDGPGQVHLVAGASLDLSPEDIEPLVMATVGSTTQIHLQRATEDRRHLRRLKLSVDGDVICSSYDADLSWPDRLRTVQEPLRQVGPDALYAYTRATAATPWFVKQWKYPPAAPYVAEGGRTTTRLWPLNTLLDRYVPDVYPQQVLTSRHLDRLSDLSSDRWDVHPLSQDRYLVSVRDTAPWLDLDPTPYAGRGDSVHTRPWAPSPEVLAQARADFDPIILTKEVVETHHLWPSRFP